MKPFPAPLSARRLIVGATAAALLVLVAALVALFRFDPSQHNFYPKCLLHSLTGLNCAGCGALRATHHLLHGEFLLALRCNALLILAMSGPVLIGFRWLRGEPPASVLSTWLSRPTPVLIFLGIAVAFSVLRNLPGPAFAWMNP